MFPLTLMSKAIIAMALMGALTAAYFGWHHKVYQEGFVAREAIAIKDEKKLRDDANAALDAVNSKNRMRELALSTELSQQVAQSQKDKRDADLKIATLRDDIRDHKLRLSVAISATSRAKICASSATAGGDSQESRAELSTTDADFFVRFAGEADDTARQLNACIDTYNKVRTTINETTP